ncbi:hypothetical protein KSP40_PGU019017 [Platanthera guangdongensis]|uniref:UDP-N-acetylglucosamine--dolichyl-phosphate N-acetylglucosaminephosphotransferase n=1 Tax=Platanthera guangdongensis TaxID=2320717 RepID=A0ABR2MM44_9ASPA
MVTQRRRSPTLVNPDEPELRVPVEDLPLAPPKLGLILGISVGFFVPFFYLVFFHYRIEEELRWSIAICFAMSFAGFFLSLKMIPVAARYLLRRNLFGYDINKNGTPQGMIRVPESLGIVISIVYILIAILFQHFNFTADSNWLVEYNAALLCICFMTLLGFLDDVLDVPWRMKLVLPSFAALPLLMAYAGHTSIIIPKPLIQYVGVAVLDLGWIYKFYMGIVTVFCTNSINIHAGINGLEVGQTVVIAAAILIHNVMQIGASSDPEYKQAHAFSIYLVLPLLTTSLALFSYNWYPSSVFVGDSYTYFAGMAMAVVGILGHFRRVSQSGPSLRRISPTEGGSALAECYKGEIVGRERQARAARKHSRPNQAPISKSSRLSQARTFAPCPGPKGLGTSSRRVGPRAFGRMS